LLTDGHGIPLAVVIEGANRHDMKLARPTLESLKVERPSLLAVWPQGLCMDKGYDYPQIQQLAVELGYRPHIRWRGEEKQQRKKGQRARRWVVERTHSWLNRFRGLLIRWAKKQRTTSPSFTWLAASSLGDPLAYWDR
jgi:transposase